MGPAKLKTGTWEDVLLQMSKLTYLIDFDLSSSGYPFRRKNPHLAHGGFIRYPGWFGEIWMLDDFDVQLFRKVERQVKANRTAARLRENR